MAFKFLPNLCDAHKTWPFVPFLIINLSLPIKAREKQCHYPCFKHPEQGDPNRMGRRRKQTSMGWMAWYRSPSRGLEGNCKKPGGHFDRFLSSASKIDQVKKLLVCPGSHRAYKAWVEAGLRADNELHRSWEVFTLQREEVVIRLCCLPLGIDCRRRLSVRNKSRVYHRFSFYKLRNIHFYVKLFSSRFVQSSNMNHHKCSLGNSFYQNQAEMREAC